MKVSDKTEDEAAADYMHHCCPGISGRVQTSIFTDNVGVQAGSSDP